MKKNNLASAIIAGALIIAAGCMVIGFGGDAAPGTEADPVVTKSYVDKAIADAAEKIQVQEASASAVSAGWEALFFEKGNTIICGAGTELILRSGQALAYDETENGYSDLTAGGNLHMGDDVTLNHLLLIPRADGRGLFFTTDCWVMVNGAYEVK